MKPPGIYGFFGPFRFLSNFHLVEVVLDGLKYHTTEAAYQAAKTDDLSIRRLFASLKTGREAKRLSHELQAPPGWHEGRKFEVMLDLTRQKFAADPLRQWLLETKDLYLEETNSWNDIYWGVCNGVGDNHLGKILMQVRNELRSSSSLSR